MRRPPFGTGGGVTFDGALTQISPDLFAFCLLFHLPLTVSHLFVLKFDSSSELSG